MMILTILFLSGASPARPALLTVPMNKFGYSLFQQLSATTPADNVVISPYSITTALLMTANGAAGETRATMVQSLKLSGLNLKTANLLQRQLSAGIARNDSGVILEIANSLWLRQGVVLKSGFRKNMERSYQAQLFTIDFNSTDAPARINQWVSQQTKNKIRSIVDRLKPEVALLLLNAIYFKGKWQQPFSPELTAEAEFHLPDGQTQLVKMMHRRGKFQYCAGPGFKGVELPYGNGNVSMFLLLPDESIGTAGLLKNMTEENWATWRAGFESRSGTVALPRFKIEYEQSLKPALTQLGMGLAFDLNRADFSAMTSTTRLAIGDVKHKTYIEVNEEGTEAAAVTSVEMVMTALPVNTFELVFNRPFLFLIQDNSSGAILFLGLVCNPGS
ncbi:MAG: serpin family protein [candidate division WOR-3 bacterium]|jgi:serpin B